MGRVLRGATQAFKIRPQRRWLAVRLGIRDDLKAGETLKERLKKSGPRRVMLYADRKRERSVGH